MGFDDYIGKCDAVVLLHEGEPSAYVSFCPIMKSDVEKWCFNSWWQIDEPSQEGPGRDDTGRETELTN